MNRGTLNSYTINAPAKNGGAVRVAADLIGRAFIAASARVHRRLTGPMTAAAQITGRVGRRMTRERVAQTMQAVLTVIPRKWVFSPVAATGEAVTALTAYIGRRALMAAQYVGQVDLVGRVFRREPLAPTGQATAVVNHSTWKRAATALQGVAEIAVTPTSFAVQYVRTLVGFVGQASPTVAGQVGRRAEMAVTARAQIALFAGVQNDFPYDEDAPDERVFVVAFEDNVFYVVS